MKKCSMSSAGVVFVLSCLAVSVVSAEARGEGKQLPTAKVKREPFRVKLELGGVFLPSESYEVVVRPERWSDLKVLDAARHGARVKRGELLLALDTEGIDRAIEATRRNLKELDLGIDQAREELQAAERDLPEQLEALERRKRETEEDLRRFLAVDKPFRRKAALFSVKRAQWNLLYQQEELKQLERMYREDELTEETEEIVLKRQRNNVEAAKFSLERTRLDCERELEVTLPREEKNLKEAAREAAEAWEDAQTKLPRQVELKRRALEAKRREREEAERKLNELLSDRKAMIVKAPFEGIVYYGSFRGGAWSGPGAGGDRLQPGSAVQPGSVLMTLVARGTPIVRALLPEERLHLVSKGMKAEVVPVGFPDRVIKGVVRSVGMVPKQPGKFDCEIALHGADKVVPGMQCRVNVICYERKSALVLPKEAVFTEGDTAYVYVRGAGGKFLKKRVRVGKESGGKVEILSGLKAGQVVSLKKPEAEK